MAWCQGQALLVICATLKPIRYRYLKLGDVVSGISLVPTANMSDFARISCHEKRRMFFKPSSERCINRSNVLVGSIYHDGGYTVESLGAKESEGTLIGPFFIHRHNYLDVDLTLSSITLVVKFAKLAIGFRDSDAVVLDIGAHFSQANRSSS